MVNSTDEFKAQSKHFVFCHIDAEKQPSVASAFSVQGYPDIRFIKGNGTEVHRVGGYEPKEPFLKDMEEAWSKGGL